jgi:hypothetical protein
VRAVPAAASAPAVSPWVLALLLLASLYTTRWALRPRALPGLGPSLVVAGGLVAVFGVAWLTYGFATPVEFWRRLVDWGDFISPVFLGLVACAYMWWQGIVMGRSLVPQEHLERTFYGGIAAFALLFSVNQLRPLIRSSEALLAALSFFATGLACLALVSVENARRWQAHGSGTWPSLNRYWLGTVLSVIGSILLVGLFVGALLSPDVFARLNSFMAWLANAVTIAIVVFMGTIVFFAAWLVTPILQRMSSALGNNPFQFPRFPAPQELGPQTLAFFERYPALNLARQGLSLLLLILVVGLVFWYAARRLGRLANRSVDEIRDNIATPELLLNQLRSLFRRRGRASAAGPAYLPLAGPRDDPRILVRRAYQAMLSWAQTFSLPGRRAGETPAAYAATLAAAMPDGREAFEMLTRVYVFARYAAEAPSLDQARLAQAALAQLQALGSRRVQTPSPAAP